MWSNSFFGNGTTALRAMSGDELEREMAEWCVEVWSEEPGRTMLKEKIRLIYNHKRRTEGR